MLQNKESEMIFIEKILDESVISARNVRKQMTTGNLAGLTESSLSAVFSSIKKYDIAIISAQRYILNSN